MRISDPLIGVVGVCASGKSTLTRALTAEGFRCRHIAQEHSYVRDMWRLLTNPDILIYLEVSFEKTLERKRLNWTREEYEIQLQRLRHAYDNADIRINTDPLTPVELLSIALSEIRSLFNNQAF